MATTYPLIRNQMMTVIAGITPTYLPSEKFRVHREVQEFAEWAQAHPAACFRQFEVLSNVDYSFEGMTNAGSASGKWAFAQSCTLVVAYPRKELGRYGLGPVGAFGIQHGNERSLDDVIDADLAALDQQLGPDGSALGNWVSGLDDCRRTAVAATATKAADVLFVASTYSLLYDRSY